MLIPLQFLVDKYNPKFKGVIHVGAHYAEEHDDYARAGCKRFYYIEPCKEACDIMMKRFYDRWPIVAVCGWAAGAEDKYGVIMNTASFNKGESNSILKPLLHLQQHPEVVFDGQETITVKKLDNIIDPRDTKDYYNFLAMDVQGYEGEVLKGATETLKYINYVYTEVNKGQTYEGNMEIDGIDELLNEFKRVETKWAGNTTWGDAFYVRRSLL